MGLRCGDETGRLIREFVRHFDFDVPHDHVELGGELKRFQVNLGRVFDQQFHGLSSVLQCLGGGAAPRRAVGESRNDHLVSVFVRDQEGRESTCRHRVASSSASNSLLVRPACLNIAAMVPGRISRREIGTTTWVAAPCLLRIAWEPRCRLICHPRLPKALITCPCR